MLLQRCLNRKHISGQLHSYIGAKKYQGAQTIFWCFLDEIHFLVLSILIAKVKVVNNIWSVVLNIERSLYDLIWK